MNKILALIRSEQKRRTKMAAKVPLPQSVPSRSGISAEIEVCSNE
jgi:hypothetical protein